MPLPKIVVQKYGGACLSTPVKIKAVAAAVAEQYRAGKKPVVVVSAMGGATDELIRLAYEVSPHPNRRELDMLLTTGERISMTLMSMALADLGVPAISFTGSQAGLMTDGSHSQARITGIKPVRVDEELARGKVVVLAGFQGVNPNSREVTTLGRGGSDTTAVAMAAALRAERCEIVKEVDGVCTADPRLVPLARALARVDYTSLSEMCFWGAKVLHYRSVELARRENVNLFIHQWGATHESTRVGEDVGMENATVLSVNSQKSIEHLAVSAKDLNDGYAKFSQHLQNHNLAWPQLLASAFDQGLLRLMVTGDEESLKTLVRTLDSGIKRLRPEMSSVNLTCFGAVASDLPDQVLKVFAENAIVPEKILFSPRTLSVILNPEQREAAVKLLHSAFIDKA